MATHRVDIIPADAGHIHAIASGMRAADVEEVRASLGLNPQEALEFSLSSSTMAWTGTVDGEPVCMFGVSRRSMLDGSVGTPWLLGTDAIERHQAAFLRRNKGIVKEMLAAYPVLRNWVDARNTLSIRWLKWLGFEFGSPVPYGPHGIAFYPFETRRVMPVKVSKCRVSEIISNGNFQSLHDEFAREVATVVAPAPIEKLRSYEALEATGSAQAFGAFMGDAVVGFVFVMTPDVPRCSSVVAVADGLFVGRRYRKTGAGLKLIREAERHAAESGSPCLMFGTPSNGPLATVLPSIGYSETNRVFMKEVRHG